MKKARARGRSAVPEILSLSSNPDQKNNQAKAASTDGRLVASHINRDQPPRQKQQKYKSKTPPNTPPPNFSRMVRIVQAIEQDMIIDRAAYAFFSRSLAPPGVDG